MSRASWTLGSGVSVKDLAVNGRLGIRALDSNIELLALGKSSDNSGVLQVPVSNSTRGSIVPGLKNSEYGDNSTLGSCPPGMTPPVSSRGLAEDKADGAGTAPYTIKNTFAVGWGSLKE